MQKYNLSLDQAIRNGLKIDERVGLNAQALDSCSGLQATPFGLKQFQPIIQPISDTDILTTLGETIGYPFPQLFRGKAVTLLCFEDEVYEVDESTWTATKLTFYDAAHFGNDFPGAATITAGGTWHFMDFHTTWALFNGVTCIFKTGHYSKPIATDAVTIGTGCSIKSGRAVLAGFDPSNFYFLADWPSYWETMYENVAPEIRQKAEAMAGGAGTNWVWWSTIGGGDLLWLISKDLYLNDDKPSEDMITNGSFTGASTGWSLGANWAYGTNNLIATNSFGTASQLGTAMREPVVAGNSYSIRFTVSSRSSGTVRVLLGAVAGTLRSADGTYTQTLTAAVDGAALNFLGDDFTGNIDSVSMALVGSDSYNGTMSPWREIMQRNEFGMAPMPWQGTVLKVERLGDAVVVYGDGGVTAIVPYSTPVATFGVRDIQGIGRGVGIASRSAAGGGIYEHVFVDRAGELWRIKGDLTAERLGYGWIFSEFLGSSIVVSHDPQRNEYYISGETDTAPECYVLAGDTLSKAPWVPTRVSYEDGSLIAIMPGSDTAGVEIITTKFGGEDRRSIDQVSTVSVTTIDTDTTGWSCALDYRFNKGDDWTRSDAVVLDDRGVARMNIPGLEFRVVLTHPDRTKCDIDSIVVEMQTAGRKNLSILI